MYVSVLKTARNTRSVSPTSEVALGHVGDIGAALGIEHGDAAIAVAHEGPLGGLAPVISRTPPASRRMFTPEMESETWKSA
jgi:hypothetical protein